MMQDNGLIGYGIGVLFALIAGIVGFGLGVLTSPEWISGFQRLMGA